MGIKKSKQRTLSSRRWLDRQHSDPYVIKARQAGYRSRSAFKLLEIQEKDRLFGPGMFVVDLGAAPGGWTQVVAKLVGEQGKIFALDILPMESIEGADILIGDFREKGIFDQLCEKCHGKQIDLVISDMAPNLSGMRGIDQAKSSYIADLILDFAQKVLKPKGALLVKVFQGEGFQEYVTALRKHFKRVVIRKPQASRKESREVYLLATEYSPAKN
jgi:23S rRNA (uridine2552-2'-O)-methyltransferase